MTSRAKYAPQGSEVCDHSAICTGPSSHAGEVGYFRQTAQQREAAATSSTLKDIKGKKESKMKADESPLSFPAPLILPGDDLSLDPRCPPQSLRAWLRLKERNEVTEDRNIIYVATPPTVDMEVDFVRTWSDPNVRAGSQVAAPGTQDVIEYLSAFYHGMRVQPLPSPKLTFTSWDNNSKAKSKAKAASPRYIGLATSTECVRIRARSSPDGVFPGQLNLDDLLDAAISILPDDAYALLLLVHHDLFESADDEFVCGRAYGGSRVAVVSTARYHPALDRSHNVETEHAWPASHCERYVQTCCSSKQSNSRPKKKAKTHTADLDPPPSPTLISPTLIRDSPLQAAISAHAALPPTQPGLWLSRVCRTASHELGHCFGIDHCVYYACAMQGSASLSEDARQPPYLCPVDESKLVRATGVNTKQRYDALLLFCHKHMGTHMFFAFASWIDARLARSKNTP